MSDFYPREAKTFFSNFREHFENEHEDDLRNLQAIALPEHVSTNEIARIYQSQRYRVTLSQTAFFNLIQFLESKEKDGGAVIISILQTRLNVIVVEKTAEDQFSFARLLERAKHREDFPAEDEGIPGHNPGSAKLDSNAGSAVLTKLKLGQITLDAEGRQDVLYDLEDEDKVNPPVAGQQSLVETFEQRIKREESEEVPGRTELPPRPPPLARDVAMEVQKVKEARDQLKLAGRTGGVGPGINVVMYTFHNTNDGYELNPPTAARLLTNLSFPKPELLVSISRATTSLLPQVPTCTTYVSGALMAVRFRVLLWRMDKTPSLLHLTGSLDIRAPCMPFPSHPRPPHPTSKNSPRPNTCFPPRPIELSASGHSRVGLVLLSTRATMVRCGMSLGDRSAITS